MVALESVLKSNVLCKASLVRFFIIKNIKFDIKNVGFTRLIR